MTIKVKRTLENAKLPFRANPTDAGADLFSPESFVLDAHGTHFVDLGIQIEIPDGYCGLIFARSGLGSKHGIRPRNCVGVIDSKYRGNLGVMLENSSDKAYHVEKGERIAQLVIVPIALCDFEETEELDMTDDRQGGFGHTGK